MAFLRTRRSVAGLLFLIAMTGWAAAQPEKSAVDKDKTGPRGTDALKSLPPNAIIVVCEDLKTANQLRPNLILLTPKQYQEMRDQIAQSKNKSDPEEAVPGECRLTGKVDGDVVRLQAEFEFVTVREHMPVLLACRLGQPTVVTLDGNLPFVYPTDRGLIVLAETKGKHQAKIDLEVNLVPKGDRGRERGFELDLPGAAMTKLELEVPEGVKEVALGVSGPARSSPHLIPTRLDGNKQQLVQLLGPAKNLEVSWKGPPVAAAGPPSLTAQGIITIRVMDHLVSTETEWTLKASGRPVGVWRLHVPPNGKVTLKSPGGDDRPLGEIETPKESAETLRILRLKEPTLDPIQVVVEVEQKRGQGPMPIGPFAVEGAVRQRGDLLLSAPADARLRVIRRGMLSLRDASADELRRDKDLKSAFTYWSVPTPDGAGQPFPPLLELEADSSQGAVEARVEHVLKRTQENWTLRTVLHVTPLAAGVEALSLQLPVDYRIQPVEPRLDEPAYSIIRQEGSRVVEIKLEKRQTKRFQLTLDGVYASPPVQVHQAALELPQLQQAQGRGPHKVVIELLENQEIEAPRERDPPWEVERSRYNRQTWTSERMPKRIEIAWQPHRQEVLLGSVADIILRGRAGQVEQQIWLASGQAPTEVRFPAPKDIADVRVEHDEWNPETRILTLPRDVTEKRPLRVRYTFAARSEPVIPAAGQEFPIPLFAPDPEIRCETKLRITCESPALVERVGGPWDEQELEATADGTRLASLVLRGDRPDKPPLLRLSEAAALATVGVERALIRAVVSEQGQQTYVASFLLNPAGVRHLDIEFPAPPTSLNVKISIGGLPANWGVPENRVARVPLGPGEWRKLTLLEVAYQIAPGQIGGANSGWTRMLGPLQTILYPPRLCGQAVPGSVRWQVVLPPDWVPLCDDGSLPVDLSWGWRGWLVGTRPTASAAELENWFAPPEERAPADIARAERGNQEEGGQDARHASVVTWRTDLDPLSIRHAPQQAWLLGCSTSLLAVVWGLYIARNNRVVFWLLMATVFAGALAIGLEWSGALSAVIYGCEPGLAALLVVGTMQWLVHRRYRRQVVFLPSFKRAKAGDSSVILNGPEKGSGKGDRTRDSRGPVLISGPPISDAGRVREPSTVDAVPPISGNQWGTGGPSPSAAGRPQLPGSSQTKAPIPKSEIRNLKSD
jgi:hypothetical protein